MKLTTYTAKKGYESKLTIKSPNGSFKSNGQTNEVEMTFELDSEDQLKDETEIAKECNAKVREALGDLHNPNLAWMEDTERETEDYKESKGYGGR